MQLIDYSKLRKRFSLEPWPIGTGNMIVTLGFLDSLAKKCTLTPTDLAELDAKALKVLVELRGWLDEQIKRYMDEKVSGLLREQRWEIWAKAERLRVTLKHISDLCAQHGVELPESEGRDDTNRCG